jgi:hypothetical protein
VHLQRDKRSDFSQGSPDAVAGDAPTKGENAGGEAEDFFAGAPSNELLREIYINLSAVM